MHREQEFKWRDLPNNRQSKGDLRPRSAITTKERGQEGKLRMLDWREGRREEAEVPRGEARRGFKGVMASKLVASDAISSD